MNFVINIISILIALLILYIIDKYGAMIRTRFKKTFISGDPYYTLNAEYRCRIRTTEPQCYWLFHGAVSPRKNQRTFTIPRSIIGWPVLGIDSYAFYKQEFSKIEIPETIRYIYDAAFAECNSIKTLTIPDSVNEIGSGAFYGCLFLTDIHLPNNLEVINAKTFAYCKSLERIILPKSIKEIESMAFYSAISLSKLIIPDGCTHIGSMAFCCCFSLTEIHIPDGCTHIGSMAFCCCHSLYSIHLPQTLQGIGDYAFSDFKVNHISQEDNLDALDRNARYIELYYSGTISEWNRITGTMFLRNTVHCLDGDYTFEM